MTRPLSAFSSALALLALPGCACEVLVADTPDLGLFGVHQHPPNRVSVSAAFYKREVSQPKWEEIESDGACRLDHFAPPESSIETPLLLDAGELRVTGGLTDFTMDFESGYFLQEMGTIFEAGDVLTLHVEGSDEVAPMSASLAAPPTPVIAPPPATLDIGEDFTITWTSPPGTGRLTINVQSYWDAVKTDYSSAAWGPRDIVSCSADISQGALTMPASLLSQISTSGSRPASISVMVSNHEDHQFGKSRVGFTLGTDAATPSGEAYRFDADLK